MIGRQIPFAAPTLDDAEVAAVLSVLSGSQLVHGPVAAEFERRFAERVGVEHAVSLSSCTAGLHLALLAMGVGPGDHVIVPAMTHVATAHSVEYCGATPVFVDVLEDCGNIDPGGFEAALDGGRVDAAFVVHYLGLPCEMDSILSAADDRGVPVIEDCALGIDARFSDRFAGSLGRGGAFSFYPAKHMTTAEGGMFVTDDADLAAGVRRRKAFGYDRMLGERARPGVYDVDLLGYNYRMSEVHAAIGVAQLDKLDGFQAARERNFRALAEALADLDVTVFADVRGEARSSHYCLNAVLPQDASVSRDVVVETLKELGIGSSVHYPSAVPSFSYYREKYGYRPGQFPVAEWLAAQTISLPVGPHVTADDVPIIAAALDEGIRRGRVGGTQ
jgi:dTDP-4-amino-4,6-dideoxygalactose transaminase